MSGKKRERKVMLEVAVRIVPVSGRTVEKTVTVPANATVEDVAKAAGLASEDLKKKNYYLDDKPATLETGVGLTPQVKITERPQGS